MKIISALQVHQTLSYPSFIDSLHETFASNFTMPPRQVMLLDDKSGSHDAFAMLPSWNEEVIALKAFTYFPENTPPHQTLYSQIMLFDRKVGTPLALVDGVSVTCLRTAGVSALASRFLSRKDSSRMLMVGTGKLAPFIIRAHASVRPLTHIEIWGRSPAKAQVLLERMSAELPKITFSVASDLEASCRAADIIVCATGSHDILVHGDWLKPGAHADFLGNHHATKRECDTATITRSRVFVDTRINCFKEAGEILVPVAEGAFSLDRVAGELSELCRGTVVGRENDTQITVFKSVGCALGDLCGAKAVYGKN
ncbi:MAG TPA: ornithine cyclodeaminase family protein [Luteolibacter sp.]|nr:ornithine cyclodeaminase family protein [Luteolibacter sp.]